MENYDELREHPMVRFTVTPNFRWDHDKKEVTHLNPKVIKAPLYDIGSITPHTTLSWKITEERTIKSIIDKYPNRYYVFYLNSENGFIFRNEQYSCDVVRMALIPMNQPKPCPCCGFIS